MLYLGATLEMRDKNELREERERLDFSDGSLPRSGIAKEEGSRLNDERRMFRSCIVNGFLD